MIDAIGFVINFHVVCDILDDLPIGNAVSPEDVYDGVTTELLDFLDNEVGIFLKCAVALE